MDMESNNGLEELPVVHADHACKRYKGKNNTTVLNGFNMTVKRGTIYSLLGASGCGKTTVLQCCVGLNKLDSGRISVFGERSGNEGSAISGKRVGYMPQELSLYGEFTIREALEYFGRIYGMNRKELVETMGFLVKLLDLPTHSRRISTLSGGQKRRVSFAVALIHKPELLILDEPTVGVDPLLRQSIWNHLCDLVSSKRTTVIITTHYIEEARKSDKIGLMRNGRLLTEKSPESLMSEHNAFLLEDIVLKLCMSDDRDASVSSSNSDSLNAIARNTTNLQKEPETISNNMFNGRNKSLAVVNPGFDDDENCIGLKYAHSDDLLKETKVISLQENNTINKSYTSHKEYISQTQDSLSVDGYELLFSKLLALTIKNYLMLMRNIGFLLFVFFVPALQIIVICLAIGNDPKLLRIGVVNHDIEGVCGVISEGCVSSNLSCRYLDLLPKETITQINYNTEEEALSKVQSGRTWGYVAFPTNYSSYMMNRALTGNFASNDTIENSKIRFHLDMSNKQIGQTLKKVFFDTFQKYLALMLGDCGYDPNEGQLPMTFETPIYGTDDTSFREFLAPSVLLGLLFFFPLCSSGLSYITEKKTGTLERSLVAGVTTAQIMISYVLTQAVVLIGQSAFAFIILTLVFSIEVHGSVMLAVSLSVLIGVGGLSMGFLVATFCTEEIEAVLLAIGSFFPNFLLAGMVWPTQGMPLALQYFSHLLPCTLACESMRSIISRGWGFTHPTVWPGFVSTIIWIIVYWTLTVILHRFSNR